MPRDLTGKKFFLLGIVFSFLLSTLGAPRDAHAQTLTLPIPGQMVALSAPFVPAHLLGMTIHPDDPLKFDFLVHTGNAPMKAEDKQRAYTQLVRYFMASLTVPDKDQWVNLSPYEHNRIIEDNLGRTEVGRQLLAQDYLLKQLTSSLMYPESSLGKKFWERVFTAAHAKLGLADVPVNMFNKVWIVPDHAVVYEHGGSAYIMASHLKVMLEEDYLALRRNVLLGQSPKQALSGRGAVTAQIVRDIVLPVIEQEVNGGENFAPLRQIVSAMLLATWYKKALKESVFGRMYADQSKMKGIEQDPKKNEEIYQQYIAAFKKGVYSYIKEDEDRYSHRIVPRKYFAGGFQRGPVTVVSDRAAIAADTLREAGRAWSRAEGRLEKISVNAVPQAQSLDKAMSASLEDRIGEALSAIESSPDWAKAPIKRSILTKIASQDWGGARNFLRRFNPEVYKAVLARGLSAVAGYFTRFSDYYRVVDDIKNHKLPALMDDFISAAEAMWNDGIVAEALLDADYDTKKDVLALRVRGKKGESEVTVQASKASKSVWKVEVDSGTEVFRGGTPFAEHLEDIRSGQGFIDVLHVVQQYVALQQGLLDEGLVDPRMDVNNIRVTPAGLRFSVMPTEIYSDGDSRNVEWRSQYARALAAFISGNPVNGDNWEEYRAALEQRYFWGDQLRDLVALLQDQANPAAGLSMRQFTADVLQRISHVRERLAAGSRADIVLPSRALSTVNVAEAARAEGQLVDIVGRALGSPQKPLSSFSVEEWDGVRDRILAVAREVFPAGQMNETVSEFFTVFFTKAEIDDFAEDAGHLEVSDIVLIAQHLHAAAINAGENGLASLAVLKRFTLTSLINTLLFTYEAYMKLMEGLGWAGEAWDRQEADPRLLDVLKGPLTEKAIAPYLSNFSLFNGHVQKIVPQMKAVSEAYGIPFASLYTKLFSDYIHLEMEQRRLKVYQATPKQWDSVIAEIGMHVGWKMTADVIGVMIAAERLSRKDEGVTITRAIWRSAFPDFMVYEGQTREGRQVTVKVNHFNEHKPTTTVMAAGTYRVHLTSIGKNPALKGRIVAGISHPSLQKLQGKPQPIYMIAVGVGYSYVIEVTEAASRISLRDTVSHGYGEVTILQRLQIARAYMSELANIFGAGYWYSRPQDIEHFAVSDDGRKVVLLDNVNLKSWGSPAIRKGAAEKKSLIRFGLSRVLFNSYSGNFDTADMTAVVEEQVQDPQEKAQMLQVARFLENAYNDDGMDMEKFLYAWDAFMAPGEFDHNGRDFVQNNTTPKALLEVLRRDLGIDVNTVSELNAAMSDPQFLGKLSNESLRSLAVPAIYQQFLPGPKSIQPFNTAVFHREVLRSLYPELVPARVPADRALVARSRSETTARPVSPGGIDLNAAHFTMLIKRAAGSVRSPMRAQDVAELARIQGFKPVVTHIVPAAIPPDLPIPRDMGTVGG